MSLKAKALIGACALALLTAGSTNADPSDGYYPSNGGGFDIGQGHGGDRDRGDRGRGDRDSDRHPHEVQVDKLGGPYRTISEGIRAAGWGGIVRVAPGVYAESLDIRRPVTILGLVNRPGEFPLPVKIQAPADKPCVDVEVEGSGFVSINQIDLSAGAQNVQRSCVELESGFLSIKDSTILAPSYVSTVLVRGGHLSIETTTISGGREGILIAPTRDSSTGTYYFVGNKITQNITGIKVDGLAQANIVGNDISRNSSDGVIYFQGRGSIIGNDIHDNTRAGLVLQDGQQSPTVKANKIYQNAGPGIEIVPATTQVTQIGGRPLPVSRGEICDNLIVDNSGAGIESKIGTISPNCKNDVNGNKDGNRRRRGGLWGDNN